MKSIRVKKLVPGAVLPKKAHASDAGFDLVAVSVEEDRKREIVTYHTGIAMEIPEGYVGLVFPRSSVYKHQLVLSNCVGVIDSGYRGEILFKYRVMQPHVSRYCSGDRIGQIVIVQLPEFEMVEAEDLSESNREAGGFGSTGR